MDLGLFIVDGCINMDFANGDFLGDEGLETAVLISLFSDAKVLADELPAGESTRRGWWGDLFPDVENDKIGSKLWLSDRGKRTLANLTEMEAQATKSLEWMKLDGLAKDVFVEGEFLDEGISLAVSITKTDDSENLFKVFWNAQEIKRA
ncbi:MAG: phage GP46 family protein [Deltaproteobacteria bacterium]|nr:phage GP46 family protein [Deltaproteobacteria bacterium]